MDVAEEVPLGGRREGRAAAELGRAADVVKQRSREQEVGPQPLVQLGGLAAERRDPDRVLEQAARIAVVAVGPAAGSVRKPVRTAESPRIAPTTRGQAGVCDLGGDELQEPVELLRVAAHRRCERGRILVGGLERAHVELEPVPELLDATEHPHGVALREATRRAARRRARPAPRSGRSGRRARARDTSRLLASAAAPSWRPRTRPRPRGRRRARRSTTWTESRLQARWYARPRWPTCSPSARSATAAAGPLDGSSRRRTT